MGARERERGLPILDKVLVSICYAEPHLGKKNKPLGGAFYPLLAIAGGKPGALWPGDGKATSSQPWVSGIDWISRMRPDRLFHHQVNRLLAWTTLPPSDSDKEACEAETQIKGLGSMISTERPPHVSPC